MGNGLAAGFQLFYRKSTDIFSRVQTEDLSTETSDFFKQVLLFCVFLQNGFVVLGLTAV